LQTTFRKWFQISREFSKKTSEKLFGFAVFPFPSEHPISLLHHWPLIHDANDIAGNLHGSDHGISFSTKADSKGAHFTGQHAIFFPSKFPTSELNIGNSSHFTINVWFNSKSVSRLRLTHSTRVIEAGCVAMENGILG
jgi:hypothetical protein